MADSSINSFMSAFDGGSRPNMYSISLVCPIGPIPQLQFYCKAATLPQSFLGEIMVPYMGRVAKYPGDRQFDDWTIDVLNDQNMTLRNTFELWNELFNSNSGNSTPYPNPRAAFGTAVVSQLDRNYKVIKWYQFFDLWPELISQVQLGYDQNDTVSDFQVTFKYSYFVSSSSPFQTNSAVNVGNGSGVGSGSSSSSGASNGFSIGGSATGANGQTGGFGLNTGGSGGGTSFGLNTGAGGMGVSF